jgi:tRNA wybutosine-synthesizing protein 1
MLSEEIKKVLKKQHYRLVGKNGAVQICRWTKKSLLDKGFCYKEQFYGIKSHRCCQMSPFLACPNECVHCWRPIELTGLELDTKPENVDKPKELIEKCVEAQRKLLNGFGGNEKVNRQKLKEAQNPSQFAISLIGEPTLYPWLAELILELRKQGKTSFLVTNGLYPEKLLELKKKNALPTQLYISLNTSNKEMYEEWHKSRLKDAWKRFNKTLELFKKLPVRRVVRMTLVKDKNICLEKEYAGLIKKSDCDFIEVKAFISVGFSRKRLGYERMPSHAEVKEFAEKLAKELKDEGYKILDEKQESRVVLIGKDKKSMIIREV